VDDKVIRLYENFRRGGLDRRGFLEQLARLVGGAAAAAALLPALEGGQAAPAPLVAPDDPGLRTGHVAFRSATGDIRAYSARPKVGPKRPGVVVISEIFGLNAHIEDVARRVAKEGYLALAPDALSASGGSPKSSDEAAKLMRNLDRETNLKNFLAAVEYLRTDPQSTGKVAAMGFCWGGGVTNQLAVSDPRLAAAVPFYGMQPAAEDVPKIKAAMLIHYAGDDERIDAGIPAFEAALKKAGVDYRIFMYPGAQHSFFNNTGPRYNKEAAGLAWQRTLAFYKEKLKG
jgi:carboxymethylenebutenolidase